MLLVDEQNGGETSPEGVEAPASTRFTIEKKEIEGKLDFDWDRLRETLVKVKEAYPKHFSIILLPDNGIDYATIVRMMDVSREYEIKAPDGTKKTEWLFPSPVLAWAVK
ncbi:MAG: hypothetical protein M5R36_19380 [Deltaproteobacteria bacterium]|nr:hypothetical protein [Deltaproteobacteria bacterium]